MEITGDPPPLWPQLSNSMPRRRPHSSPLLSPPVLIILLPIIALILLFFAVPPFVSMATQIFRPYGVRRSWDSLNILLVLFAILCGVFARRNDEEDNNSNAGHGSGNVRSDNVKAAAGSQQWFEYPERKIYGDGGLRRLKRNSSSYPDLRQESLWENNEDRFRFFDDFEISKYRSSNYNHPVHELRRTRSEFSEESEAKVIHVDKFVLRSSPSKSPAPSTPPPPPPPPPAARHKSRRTYQAVGQRENVIRNENDNKINSPPVTPPPPPPPPPRRPPSPLVQLQRSEQKHVKLERRKSNATKEIKMVFASLRKRKKKTKTKDQEDRQDCPLHSPREPTPYYSTTIPPPSPAPPPPPPPPPPPSVFQKYNLFKKSSKSKKIHSVPAPPPPPPPPAFSIPKQLPNQDTQIPPTPPPAPPPPFFSTKRLTRQKTRIPAPPEPPRMRTPTLTGKPPLPTKSNTSYYDENIDNGGQSPLIPMPPPPPPPPFKMPEFKFIPRGDFVKIGSSPSSRCSSPDLEETDASSTTDENIDTETASMDADVDGVGVGVAGPVPVFCPSPDVNAKAETFIARLKDGWKLEKINSLKEKRRLTA